MNISLYTDREVGAKLLQIGRLHIGVQYSKNGWQINDMRGFRREVFFLADRSTNCDFPGAPAINLIIWRFFFAFGIAKLVEDGTRGAA